jgi:ABC-2 type transport system ATP-binding protein
MIEVKELSKIFRVHKKTPGFWGSVRSLFSREWLEKQALKEVSLRIQPGEILGLLGANGAGKTTLVKILSGIIHPTSGEASVLGYRPWERNNELRRQISLIMGQKAQLWWDLPAADSFELLREIYQVDPTEHKRTQDYLVESLGVQDQLHIQVRRLSLGERMKMELIAALLHKPKVVFLDEPTIGLDLTAQRAIRKFIHQYRKEHKPVMILTSHYMEDIESLCERIAIIKDGALVYDGALSKVVDRFDKDRKLTFVFEEGVVDVRTSDLPGEVLSMEMPTLQMKVKKEDLTKAVAQIMARYPVRDIQMEEQDVANVIESLIRKGLQ